MKKLVAFAFMTVFMLAMTVTANAAGKQVKATGDVNLRKGPVLGNTLRVRPPYRDLST